MNKPETRTGDALSLFALVQTDMVAVDHLINEVLSQESPLVQQVADHLLNASGKRLRPALVLLAGRAVTRDLSPLVPVAAATELIHMATLVHDDILDQAETRRGQPSLHHVYGTQVAVLAGDYLFARAFQLLAGTQNAEVVRLAASVVHTMCVGEIHQSLDRGRVASEAEYLERIEAKTATFLASSCRMGAVQAGAGAAVTEALTAYGHHIGLAYQMVDDLLDIVADPEKLGKAVATDFAQGVITLPVIYAMEQGHYGDELMQALAEGRRAHIQDVLQESGAIHYVRSKARQAVEAAVGALSPIADPEAARALSLLAQFVVSRDF